MTASKQINNVPGAVPWLIAMIGFMLLITYVPAISLWLPRLLGY